MDRKRTSGYVTIVGVQANIHEFYYSCVTVGVLKPWISEVC